MPLWGVSLESLETIESVQQRHNLLPGAIQRLCVRHVTMIAYKLLLLGMILARTQSHSVLKRTDEPVEDEVKVVTFNMGEDNEETEDPSAEWFSGVTADEMINLVRIEYSQVEEDTFVRCIGFSHPDAENNCPPEPSSSYHTVEDFILADDEYINYVSGDSHHNILSIYFKTNKGQEIGPYGMGTDPEKHQYKFSHDGDAPLLYVEGLKGLWVYSIYFSFHETHVLNLENITNDLANRTYIALNTDIEEIYEINDAFHRMYPDIARKGCAVFDEEPSFEAGIACDFEVLLDQVNILATASTALQNHTPRNLLTLKDYDSAKYLDEVKESKDFHNLMTEIKFGLNTVIDVTEQQSAELKAYFSAAAEFDMAIAEQDLIYIQSQLEAKEAGSAEASAVVEQKLEVILIVGMTSAAFEAMMEIIEFTTVIIAEMNPWNLIMGGGPDMDAIFEAMEELLGALQDVTQLALLLANLEEYVNHLDLISQGFAENQDAIDAMSELVDVLTSESDPAEIEKYADEFIKSYGDYTPQVTSQDITYCIALLDSVSSEACSIIAGIESSMVPVEAAATYAEFLCVYIAADIAVLGSYYEDIYTLQFEMIDCMTSIVRGQIALVMADQIGSIETTIDIRTAAIGTAMVETTYQAASLSRCDILEYLAAGKRPELCERLLFRDEDIQKLITYVGSMSASPRSVFAYLPTYPQTEIGIPHINVTNLLLGGYQKIRLPITNKEWLVKYGWLPDFYEPETAFFVKTMEMYLPGLKCIESNENIHEVTIQAVSSNPTYLYGEEAPPKYSVDKHLVKFEFKEPASFCAGTKMKYPMVDNNTLQEIQENEICIVSPGDIHTQPKSDFTYPSLFTTWHLSLTGSKHCTLVEDDTLTFNPLVTVRLVTLEVFVKESPDDPGIHECWPEGSRCDEGEQCVDEVLGYCCEGTKGSCK